MKRKRARGYHNEVGKRRKGEVRSRDSNEKKKKKREKGRRGRKKRKRRGRADGRKKSRARAALDQARIGKERRFFFFFPFFVSSGGGGRRGKLASGVDFMVHRAACMEYGVCFICVA